MSVVDELIPLLKKLRLSGVLQTLDLRTRQAVEDSLAHSDFLYRVLCDEVERRDGKQLEQRLRRANFEHRKTLEDFDFVFNPGIPKAKVVDLATCSFIERHENVLLIGPTGTGKSHIAQAIGHRACRAGHGVLYVAASDMLKQLRAAKADGSYDRRMLRFTSPELLIVDDLGLRPLSGDEPIDLYEIIRHRYEHGATILTSNRAIDELPALFGDPLLASAAMDRLLHGAQRARPRRRLVSESSDGTASRSRPDPCTAGGPMSLAVTRSDPFGRPGTLCAACTIAATSTSQNTGSVWPTRARSVRAALDNHGRTKGRARSGRLRPRLRLDILQGARST